MSELEALNLMLPVSACFHFYLFIHLSTSPRLQVNARLYGHKRTDNAQLLANPADEVETHAVIQVILIVAEVLCMTRR